jgi:hypothetical protein
MGKEAYETVSEMQIDLVKKMDDLYADLSVKTDSMKTSVEMNNYYMAQNNKFIGKVTDLFGRGTARKLR